MYSTFSNLGWWVCHDRAVARNKARGRAPRPWPIETDSLVPVCAANTSTGAARWGRLAGGDIRCGRSGNAAGGSFLALQPLHLALGVRLSPFPSRVAPHGQRPLWSVNRGSHRPGLRLHWHSLLSARVSHQAGFNHRKHCQTMGTPGRGESSKVQRAVPIWVGAAIAKHGRNQRTSAIGHESRRIASPSVRATRR